MYGRQSNLPHRREQRVPLLGGGAPPAGFGGGAGSADDSVRGGRGHVQAARCHTGEIHPGEEIQCADGRAHCGRVAEMSKSDTGVTESGIVRKEFRGLHGNPAQVLGYGGAVQHRRGLCGYDRDGGPVRKPHRGGPPAEGRDQGHLGLHGERRNLQQQAAGEDGRGFRKAGQGAHPFPG